MDEIKKIDELEKDIADLLLDKMEFSDMTPERAQLIARFVLAHLPENITGEQLKQILPTLDEEFIELAGIVHKYMNQYEMEEKKTVVKNVHELLKSGKLDDASTKIKEYLNKKVII